MKKQLLITVFSLLFSFVLTAQVRSNLLNEKIETGNFGKIDPLARKKMHSSSRNVSSIIDESYYYYENHCRFTGELNEFFKTNNIQASAGVIAKLDTMANLPTYSVKSKTASDGTKYKPEIYQAFPITNTVKLDTLKILAKALKGTGSNINVTVYDKTLSKIISQQTVKLSTTAGFQAIGFKTPIVQSDTFVLGFKMVTESDSFMVNYTHSVYNNYNFGTTAAPLQFTSQLPFTGDAFIMAKDPGNDAMLFPIRFDFDFFIVPIFSYSFKADFSISEDTICSFDSVMFTNKTHAVNPIFNYYRWNELANNNPALIYSKYIFAAGDTLRTYEKSVYRKYPQDGIYQGTATSILGPWTSNEVFADTMNFSIKIGGVSPSAAVTVKDATCSQKNGQVVISRVRGCSPPYKISFGGGIFDTITVFDNLKDTTYRLMIKDVNGFSFTLPSVVVKNQAPPIALSYTPTDETCKALGKIAITGVTGGLAPFEYSFNDGAYDTTRTFTNLKGGDYNFKVKDFNGCIYNAPSVNLKAEKTLITGIAITVTPANCKNLGSITLGAISPSGLIFNTYGVDSLNSVNNTSYTSNKTYSNLAPKTYVVSVKDRNSCVFKAPVTVVKNDIPNEVFITTKDATCGNSDGEFKIDSVKGGKAPYIYSFKGGTYSSFLTYDSLAPAAYTLSVKDANSCVFNAPNVIIALPPNVPTAVEVTKKNAVCSLPNGSISIGTVIGGDAPYSFSIDSAVFGTTVDYADLLPKTYKLRVKDAKGCLFTAPSVEIADKAGVNDIAVIEQHETCSNNNGQVTIGNAIGGVAPFEYSFDNSAFSSQKIYSGLDSGAHTLVVRDSNGCLFNAPDIKLIDYKGPTDASVSSAHAGCNGDQGSITIGTVTGGKAPYQYTITDSIYNTSNVFNGLKSGLYNVKVKDANDCQYAVTDVLVDSITIPTGIVFDSIISPSACKTANGLVNNNGKVYLGKVTGGKAPYTFNFNSKGFLADTIQLGLTAGTYSLSIKDSNNCVLDTNAVVNNLNAPTAVEYALFDATCDSSNGKIVFGAVTGGTAPYEYSFDNISYTSDSTIKTLKAATHQLRVRDSLGCVYTAPEFIIKNISPTAMEYATVDATCSAKNGKISVTNVIGGKEPYLFSLNDSAFISDLEFLSLQASTYKLAVKDSNNCVFRLQAVIVKDQAAPVAINVNTVDQNCAAKGSITIDSIIGGKAPFYYDFNNQGYSSALVFDNLLNGTYQLKVIDSNLCEFSSPAVVINMVEPTALNVDVVGTSCSLDNGQVKITGVVGGLPPYLYNFDSTGYKSDVTYLNLKPKTYKLSVKDANGCMFNANELTVTGQIGISAIAYTTKDVICAAATGQLNIGEVTGGKAPFTYNFNNLGFSNKTNYSGLNFGTFTLIVKDSNNCTYNAPSVVLNNFVAPSAAVLTIKGEICSGSNGELAIGAITGGKAPYLYNFNNWGWTVTSTYSNLAAGNYNLIIKDANDCFFNAPLVKITDSKITAVTVTSKDANCSTPNGEVNITKVTGGKAPYNYNFKNLGYTTTANYPGLTGGVYSLSVKDSEGCIFDANDIVLNDQPGPSGVSLVSKDASCSADNGSVSIGAVTSGKAPYQYNFNNAGFNATLSYSGLKAALYKLVVKDANGCLYNSPDILINSNTAPTAVAVTSNDEICSLANGQVTIGNVTGGTSPYMFNLNNMGYTTSKSYSNIAGGNISLIVKDANDCIFSAPTVFIKNIKPEEVTFTSTMPGCRASNGQVNLGEVTGGKAPYTFSFNSSAFDVNKTFLNLKAGTYKLSVKDANSCLYNAPVVVIEDSCEILSGIMESYNNSGVSVYPNPATDFLTVKIAKLQNASILLYDLTGKVVLSSSLGLATNSLDISGLDKGFYVYKIISQGKELITGKFSVVK